MGTEHSIVRILRHGQEPVGLGFAVDEHHILTCAHVVNVALGGRGQEQCDRPIGANLIIDFPLLQKGGDQVIRAARLAMWAPRPGQLFGPRDIAGLFVGESLPVPQVALADTTGQRVQMWGPSDRRANGGHIVGRLLGSVDAVRSHVDQELYDIFRVARGFSGGPVWNPTTGQVVGMLQAVGIDDDATDVYVLRCDAVVNEWPEVLWRPPPCPYRGLAPFDEESAGLYFGRTEFVRDLVVSSSNWKQRTAEVRDRWLESDRDPGYLLRGSVLERAEEMLARHPAETMFLRNFIGESRRA